MASRQVTTIASPGAGVASLAPAGAGLPKMGDGAAPIVEPAAPQLPAETVVADPPAPGAQEKRAPDLETLLRAETRKRKQESQEAARKRELDERELRIKGLEDLDAQLKTDPLGFLANRGVGWDALSKQQIAAKTAPVAKTAEQLRIERLEQQLADRKKREDDADAKRPAEQLEEAKQYLADWTKQTAAAVAKLDPAAHEHLFSVPNPGELVAGMISDHYRKTGQMVEIADAAKAVEKDLAGKLPTQIKDVLKNPVVRRLALAELKEELEPKGLAMPAVRNRGAIELPHNAHAIPTRVAAAAKDQKDQERVTPSSIFRDLWKKPAS